MVDRCESLADDSTVVGQHRSYLLPPHRGELGREVVQIWEQRLREPCREAESTISPTAIVLTRLPGLRLFAVRDVLVVGPVLGPDVVLVVLVTTHCDASLRLDRTAEHFGV